MSHQETNDLIVGIDLGTTNSLVSVVDSGFPIVLADESGKRLLPSVVTFLPAGRVLVGEPAIRSQAFYPKASISSIKRVMGRRYAELSPAEIAELPFLIAEAADGSLLVDLGEMGKKLPEEISAAILSQLKVTAEKALECAVNRAVITVPAYFGHRQREATRRAAELAGWQVERILNEPTAAALAYGLNQSHDGQRVAVYDLGGGTFDLSILELRDGVFEVIATSGDTRLGGDDIDWAIFNWFLAETGRKMSLLSPEQRARLQTAARQAKERLSTLEKTSLDLPFFDGPTSFSVELTREKLETLALPFLERTRVISKKAFLEAEHKSLNRVQSPTVQGTITDSTGYSPRPNRVQSGTVQGSIDQLILVGGSTRMPLVQSRLEEWFGIKPNLTQHPDEAIAIGAGIQAGIMCGRVRQVVLLDVVPLSLGIETIGGLMNVIIPRNTTIPCKAGELFTNGVSNQASMAVRVLQGEREMARDNWRLGEIMVPFEPGPKGSARVGVQFEIDENGMLKVLSRDTHTGTDHHLIIQSAAVDVQDEAVEQMVTESIEHAFEDMNSRILTETRMKSEELLPAVQTALQLAGNQLPDDERAKIEAAAARVQALYQQAHPSLEQLKAANADLDEKTQNLAAILVEMAMDRALS
jgi:molecular chaperone DnaK